MTQNPDLDSIDRTILRELQEEGRLANKALAARVGIAPSTCLDRVARLRDAGVITGFHAIISPEAVGRGVQALLAIQFAAHVRPLVDPFVEHVRSLPETRALFHLTGADDYLIHVACSDTRTLQQLVLGLTARREVGRIQTHLIFESWPAGPIEPA